MSETQAQAAKTGDLSRAIPGLINTLDDIQKKLREIEVKNDIRPLNEKLDSVVSRLDDLENKDSVRSKHSFQAPPSVENTASVSPTRRTNQDYFSDDNYSSRRVNNTQTNCHTRPLSGNFPISSESSSLSADIQTDFKQIRDRVSGVEIPQNNRLNADRTGIKREDQVKFNVLASCAKYSETLLKVVALASNQDSDSETILSSVYTVALAQQRYIQDEYASLLVSSSFDAPTARFFKQLQKNTSSFTPEALSHLHAAATIASAHQPQSQADNTPRTRGGFRYNPRRGRFRGQTHGDVYQRFTSSTQFPSSRPHDDH